MQRQNPPLGHLDSSQSGPSLSGFQAVHAAMRDIAQHDQAVEWPRYCSATLVTSEGIPR